MRIHATSAVALALASFVLAARAQAPVFTTGTPAELEQARRLGLEHLQALTRQRGIDDQFRVTRVFVDDLSMAHVRVQQMVRAVPVFGGEAIVHLRATGQPSGVTDNLVANVKVDTTPRLSPAEAIARSKALGCSDCSVSPPGAELWILRREGIDRLVYRVQMRRIDATPAMPVLFVDAHAGDIVLRYDNLQTEVPR